MHFSEYEYGTSIQDIASILKSPSFWKYNSKKFVHKLNWTV